MSRLRTVVLCCDGLYQRYLVQRVATELDLAGIVLRMPHHPKGGLPVRLARYRNPIRLAGYLQARALLPGYQRRAQPLLQQLFYRKGMPPSLPTAAPLMQVADINAPEAVAFVRGRAPDVVLVNGTNLLREPMLALIPEIPFGIINLHTGLSPYSRGGNCNLYMLLEGHPELVGSTVHHIDIGIDSGDIIFSAQVQMEPDDNYEMIDARTFHLGIELLVTAARQLAADRAARVTQWEQGKLFLRRTGYIYEPYQRVQVNRLLAHGLVRDYLAHRQVHDDGVRLVGNSA